MFEMADLFIQRARDMIASPVKKIKKKNIIKIK